MFGVHRIYEVPQIKEVVGPINLTTFLWLKQTLNKIKQQQPLSGFWTVCVFERYLGFLYIYTHTHATAKTRVLQMWAREILSGLSLKLLFPKTSLCILFFQLRYTQLTAIAQRKQCYFYLLPF